MHIAGSEAPTQAQLSDWEKVHKGMLNDIIRGMKLRIYLGKKYGVNSTQFKEYDAIIIPKLRDWLSEQILVELKGLDKHSGFLEAAKNGTLIQSGGIPFLENVLKNWSMGLYANGEIPMHIPGMNGMGIIPLLIWAVILIIGALSADYVVHQTHKQADDQQALIKSTDDFCTKHNLTPEECSQQLTVTTNAVTTQIQSSSTPFTTYLIWGGLAFVGYKVWEHSSSHK